MFRLFFGIFAGGYRGTGSAEHAEEEEEEEEDIRHGHQPRSDYEIYESPPVMTVPMMILAVLSIIGGFVGSFALFGDPSLHPFATFLNPVFTNPQWTNVPVQVPVASLSVQWLSTGLSVGLALSGILGAWTLYRNGFFYKENNNPLYQLVLHKYYVDEFFILVLIRPLVWTGRTASRLLERDVLDGGSRGVGRVFVGASGFLRRLQTGYVRNYALAILLGVILIIVYYAVRG
jgi:NADH-quinone oxidoreductase subunit L